MTKPENDMASLWQAQPVARIDVEKIRSEYRSQAIKQRCYMLLDIMGVLPAVILVWYAWPSLSAIAAGMIVGLGVVMLPIVGYLLWLRRIAAFGSASNTSDYLDHLSRQVKNNAVIARLTRHSAWLTPLFITVFYLVIFVQGELPEEKYSLVITALGAMYVIMAGFYRWAHKREQRFLLQFKELRALRDSQA